MTQTQSNGTCVIQNCLTSWVHPKSVQKSCVPHVCLICPLQSPFTGRTVCVYYVE